MSSMLMRGGHIVEADWPFTHRWPCSSDQANGARYRDTGVEVLADTQAAARRLSVQFSSWWATSLDASVSVCGAGGVDVFAADSF
jgi:hypothetical protein